MSCQYCRNEYWHLKIYLAIYYRYTGARYQYLMKHAGVLNRFTWSCDSLVTTSWILVVETSANSIYKHYIQTESMMILVTIVASRVSSCVRSLLPLFHIGMMDRLHSVCVIKRHHARTRCTFYTLFHRIWSQTVWKWHHIAVNTYRVPALCLFKGAVYSSVTQIMWCIVWWLPCNAPVIAESLYRDTIIFAVYSAIAYIMTK